MPGFRASMACAFALIQPDPSRNVGLYRLPRANCQALGKLTAAKNPNAQSSNWNGPADGNLARGIRPTSHFQSPASA